MKCNRSVKKDIYVLRYNGKESETGDLFFLQCNSCVLILIVFQKGPVSSSVKMGTYERKVKIVIVIVTVKIVREASG